MRAAIAVLALLASSCSSASSEIILVVGTDVVEAAELRVTVISPSGQGYTSSALLADQPPPRTLVLVHRGGALGPMRATIDALDAQGRALVSVSRELTFQEGRTLRLDVFLADACRIARCPVIDTCGNAGECRSPVVDPCEYEGECVDAGAIDAGTPDAGHCDLTGASVCGVAARHLPGDLVSPTTCDAVEGAVVSVTGPDGAAIVPGPEPSQFRLQRSGVHTVRIAMASDDGCAITSSFEVSPALTIAGDPSGDPRDIAARIGTAFVAASGGAYAVDGSGWHDLRAAVSEGDVVAPSDLEAVAVLFGEPYFGPHGDLNAIYRVVTSPPYTMAMHARIGLPDGAREIRAFGVRIDGQEPLLAATKDGAVVISRLREADPTASAVGPTYDPNAFAAIGTREPGTLGAVWLGREDQLVNVSIAGLGELNLGSSVSIPDSIKGANEALVDDRDELAPRLWICGDHEVAIYDLATFGGLTALPEPIATWRGPCDDLAMDADRNVWIAARGEGLIRLDASGVELARYDTGNGLPEGIDVGRIAVAHDATAREIWMLDLGSNEVVVLSANALP